MIRYRLHPGHRHSSVIERSGPGCVTQHRPLLVLGVPPRIQACSVFTLPREAYSFPYQAPGAHVQGRPHVCQTLGSHPQAPRRERHRQAWISPETWILIDTKTAERRQGDQRNARAVACTINTELQGVQLRQAAEAGSAVKDLLASYPPLIRGAWI